MLDKFWDFVISTMHLFFVPLVCSYYALTSNLFLNTSCEEAKGLEKVGNWLLTPCHYLFVGQTAKRDGNGEWSFSDRFEYMDGHFISKTILSSTAAAPSFLLGVTLKGLAFLSKEARERHSSMEAARLSTKFHPNNYSMYGFDLETREWFSSEKYQRRPGDENNMAAEKKALREIGALFDEAGIPWWVDCGTCLGAYRYGGVIPWDEDIDVAVLIPDFDNVLHILNRLNVDQYIVQDWSTREHPKSYIKVFVRESGTLIDIYHFDILPKERQLKYVLSLENVFLMPNWWRIRESRFTVPVSFDMVFPLKRALFDGIEVNLPNDPKKYLQRCYGENLAPAKIYDPKTGKYEKDLNHPYWQRAYVH